jgi:hypothetical protein
VLSIRQRGLTPAVCAGVVLIVAGPLSLSLSACQSSGSNSSAPGGMEAADGSQVSNDATADASGVSTSDGGTSTLEAGASGESSMSGGADSATGTADFTVNVTLSSAIATVGIVTWSVDVPIDSAVINFGRDPSSFEFQAPVDLTQSNYRTLLLGMKQSTMYSLQITAQGGGKTYVSNVYTVTTGTLPSGLPTFAKTDSNASALYAGGGFTVNCIGLAGLPGIPGTVGPSIAFILDKDADPVWALDLGSTTANQCSRARMSYDGQSMWAGNFNNAATSGAVFTIGMDGMGAGQSWSLPGRSHDLAILPNGHVLYFATDNGMANTTPGGESVFELDPTSGTSTKIYDEETDFASLISSTMESHTNYVSYSPDLQAVTFSMLLSSTIGVVSYPAGKLLAVFGGTQSTFSNMNWTWQHGHEVHSDHIWIFNNNNGSTAHVLGFNYTLSSKTATATLDYNPGIICSTFGDVKELLNGNLYVTFSDKGTLQEITNTGTLLRQVTSTTAVGYSEHRGTLYGPPPPYATN